MCRKKSIMLLLLCLSMLSACAGQQRGMAGAYLVSSSRPSIELSAPDLPLRTAGFTVASVTTGDSLSGVAVDTWLAVYGATTLAQPMAIVALSEAPTNYYWDTDLYPVFSVDHGAVSYDGQGFYASTFIVDGQRDAFVTLLPINEPSGQRFIARRFAQLSNFNNSKVTLEYREPLPADVGQITDLALYDRAYLDAFEGRAYKAFRVMVPSSLSAHPTDKYLKDVQVRFLNANFLGTLSRLEMLADD